MCVPSASTCSVSMETWAEKGTSFTTLPESSISSSMSSSMSLCIVLAKAIPSPALTGASACGDGVDCDCAPPRVVQMTSDKAMTETLNRATRFRMEVPPRKLLNVIQRRPIQDRNQALQILGVSYACESQSTDDAVRGEVNSPANPGWSYGRARLNRS